MLGFTLADFAECGGNRDTPEPPPPVEILAETDVLLDVGDSDILTER
jgi:hypothetical protein